MTKIYSFPSIAQSGTIARETGCGAKGQTESGLTRPATQGGMGFYL